MEQHEILLAGSLLIGLVSIIPPGIHYLRAERASSVPNLSNAPFPPPSVTVFIPARDEALLIRDKLEEILSLEYPGNNLRLLVIDSSSLDGTGRIAEKFLVERAGSIPWKVETMESPGKSIAVNKALGNIETEFFVMTDVDSVLEPDSLLKLMRRFVENEEIGAVCGRIAVSEGMPMPAYRKRFNQIRLGESSIDSTPIFEGSVCAFRMASLAPREICSDINADDSQLAILSRRNGYRAIMDGEISFTESNLANEKQRQKSLRRAQGITRTLFRNRDLAFKGGRYGRIYLQNLYFHLMMPWFVLLGLILGISSLFTFYFQSDIAGQEIYLSSILLLGLLSSTSVAREFLFGVACLLWAQILIIVGVRLDVWKPHRAKLFSDYSQLKGSEE